jgi:hypothetical protein
MVEARQRNCFFYKARVDERSLLVRADFLIEIEAVTVGPQT